MKPHLPSSGTVAATPVLRTAASSPSMRAAAALLRALRLLPWYHGRGLDAAGRVVACLVREDRLSMSLGSATWFAAPFADPYWMRPFVFGEPYEPEVFHVLARIGRRSGVLFVDCGANRGYWSVLCSGPAFGWNCIALEADPSMFVELEENAALNGDRFRIEHAAIWVSAGIRLPFVQSPQPAGSHLALASAGSDEAGQMVMVETTTIDSVVDRAGVNFALVVLKLDIEGVEAEALDGARRTLERGPAIVVYEDHGGDQDCRVTRSALERGMIVLHPTKDGTLIPITTLAEARAHKTNPNAGYNFVAYPAKDAAIIEPLLRIDHGH